MARVVSLIAIVSTAASLVLTYQLKVAYTRIDEERGLRIAQAAGRSQVIEAPETTAIEFGKSNKSVPNSACPPNKLAAVVNRQAEALTSSPALGAPDAQPATRKVGPAAQAYARARARVDVNRVYGPLLRKLSLPRQQENAFVELLVDRWTGTPRPSAEADSATQTNPVSPQPRGIEEEVAALLGKDKVPEYSHYERVLFAKQRAELADGGFNGMGLGLTETQRDSLRALFVEEAEQAPPAPVPEGGMSSLERTERQVAWLDDFNRRVLERIQGVLTDEQFKYLQGHFERTAALRKSSIALQREQQTEKGTLSVTGYPID